MTMRPSAARAFRTTGPLAVVTSLLALAPFACSDGVGLSGDVVGGSCVSSKDCVEQCLYDQRFPAGTCSVPCGSSDQCPDGTFCVEVNNQ